MPKIDVSLKDLCRLIGRKLSTEQLREEVLYAKCELDESNGDTLKLDLKDTNRPDMWSAEGVAREIRARYTGEFPEYDVKKSGFSVEVDASVKKVRPYTTCAVVKGLKIDESTLSQIIQLQEKIAGTFGRNRREVAIGVYDLERIKFPVKYTTVKPEGIKFTPLGSKEKMTPAEIMVSHPKGKEYGHLLKDAAEYPIFIDSSGEVLSVPPIINSDYSGKVTESTRDVFIECSGFDKKLLNTAINVLAAAMHERGGTIYGVDVKYGKVAETTPEMAPKKFRARTGYIRKVAGLGLSDKEIAELLKKSLYEVKVKGEYAEVLYPAYRQDIMHERDIAEDVIISYGFNKIAPKKSGIITKGRISDNYVRYEKIMSVMTGCGMQEIMSYTLTNSSNIQEKMKSNDNYVEIENPMSANWSVFRTSLIPGLMEFFSKNQHVEYPQKIFEYGSVVLVDKSSETRTRDEQRLAAALTANAVNYEMISSVLDALMRGIGAQYEFRKSKHPSFIDGRVAEIVTNKKHIGFIGEIHPQVLNNWGIEKPVVAFEINTDGL